MDWRELMFPELKAFERAERAEPQLAAGYLRAADDGDPRVYLVALRTVARARV